MRCVRFIAIPFLTVAVVTVAAQPPAPKAAPVAATVESSLKSAQGKIRQLAFDGDADSYFASADNAKAGDHFTLVFDKPVALKSVVAMTGRPGGEDAIAGTLEISADGKTFVELARFASGRADVQPNKTCLALRIKPAGDMKHPLVVRELSIASDPPVAVFKYPIEFIVDVNDAPEMKEWADKVARLCERRYDMINEELRSDGFKPRTTITMALKSNYKGVAAAGGGRITGSVKYFKDRPGDVGAMIHETVHCVQSYRTKGNPGWLVEGIADYVRFFKFEPGKIGKIKADPHYNGSYRTSAAFLAFVTEKYDKDLVRKLNKTMRDGEYREEVWKTLTKKSIKELDDEWRASLKK